MPARNERHFLRKRNISLADVARETGVHPSTVSRALDPARRSLIGDDVVRRIQTAAKRLGFRPDPIATALRTRRSRLIGVLVPDISNPVFSPIIDGLEEALADAGWSLIVANARSADRQIALVDEFAARRVDGLVLATATRNDPVLARCKAHRLPTILVNRRDDRGRFSSVVSDDIKGMRLVVDHLAGLGHRRIAHVSGPDFLSTGHLRRQGFAAAISDHRLDPAACPILGAQAMTREAGRVAARDILRDFDPTAIVAANDLLALGVLQAMEEAGLACPKDISVTGHNDMPLTDQIAPPLTTVSISHRLLGQQAGRMLLDDITTSGNRRIQHVIEPHLVVRLSTREPTETKPLRECEKET